MSLERALGEDQGVFSKRAFLDGSADVELSLTQRVVEAGTGNGDYTITLPPVGEAVGKIFTIHAPDAGTDTDAITLTDGGHSVDWNGDYTLDADADRIALYSDGRCWWEIDNQIA